MARVLPERAVYLPGEALRILVESEEEGTLLLRRGGATIASWRVGPGTTVVEAAAEGVGIHEVALEPANVRSSFAVLEPLDSPPEIAIVFHDHQAPNYSPDGALREPWAYSHVWDDEFQPYYEGGAYLVQARLLKKWGLPWNANLSPSLLAQWLNLLERGAAVNLDGTYLCVEPESPKARRVQEALQAFRELAGRGLDVLTSFYSHPIAGYIAEVYGWLDLLREELRLGKEITSRALSVEPGGVWLPEMSFSMKLVPLLLEQGIRYTVLDALHHFAGAVGDKGGIYEPYELQGLTLFFRHTGLSDLWSFKYSSVSTVEQAEAAAVDFALRLILEAYVNRARPLTVALDGENWMILPKPKPAAAVFFDRLLGQLRQAVDRRIIKLVKLSEAAEGAEPRKLTSVPAKSWMGGYEKWTSERRSEQERIWSNVVEAYEAYKALESSVGAGAEDLMALMHVVNSDHIWAEFADESFSREWLDFLRTRLAAVLHSIRLEGVSGGKLRVRNALGRAVKVLVREDGYAREVVLQPGLNELDVGGAVVEIAVRGWSKVFRVGKPLVRAARQG